MRRLLGLLLFVCLSLVSVPIRADTCDVWDFSETVYTTGNDTVSWKFTFAHSPYYQGIGAMTGLLIDVEKYDTGTSSWVNIGHRQITSRSSGPSYGTSIPVSSTHHPLTGITIPNGTTQVRYAYTVAGHTYSYGGDLLDVLQTTGYHYRDAPFN